MSDFEVSLLGRFQPQTILNEDIHRKKLTLLGTMADDDDDSGGHAILELEKTAFHGVFPSELFATFDKAIESISLLHHNDIWYSFREERVGLKIDLTYPASPIDISKKTAQRMALVSETFDMYNHLVLPWITSHPIERNHWIRNILEGRSEIESIVFQDDDMVILPDSKWDRVSVENLYLLVIFKDEKLHSLRDFTWMHLPLLQSAQANLARILQASYRISRADCRAYFHYLPTFYWAHMHVHRVSASKSPGNFAVGQAFLLEDVIDNIKNFHANYYQQKTMHYYLGQNHPLYAALKSEE